jgi:hypothetical protein
MQVKFLWFDDLFTILTDSEYNMTWPYLVHNGPNQIRYKWFFIRYLSKQKAPEYYETPTNFVQLQGSFESIVSAWLRKREEFGPGFYLYLGTRRGMHLYTEHLFASLVWGIEALHRKKEAEDPKTAKIKERVSHILSRIVDQNDNRWLQKKLKHAHEPTLEERIFEVLRSVPIEGRDQKAMRVFATKCAALRNDVSHFGSHRHGGSYDEFHRKLRKYTEALSKLYHMLILHEIGIEEQIIKDWLYKGFRSYRMRSALVEVGIARRQRIKATHDRNGLRLFTNQQNFGRLARCAARFAPCPILQPFGEHARRAADRENGARRIDVTLRGEMLDDYATVRRYVEGLNRLCIERGIFNTPK